MTNKELEKRGGGVLDLIKQMKSQFALALPKHLTADRFLRVCLTAVNKNTKLLQCTKESLLGCLMDCSQLGIEPDGRNAHLIPYGKDCTMIIDYKGLVELARRSGDIADIHADVVYDKDEFTYSFGSDSHLKHIPNLKERGELVAVYSYVRLKDNSSSFEVMSIKDVEKIRNRSKAKNSGPWVTDFNEMAKKTVFRRHSKWLPISSEKFQEAIDKDYDVPIDILNEDPVVEMPREKIEEVKEVEKEKPIYEPEVEVDPIPEEEDIVLNEEAEEIVVRPGHLTEAYNEMMEREKPVAPVFGEEPSHEYRCSVCGAGITKKVADYSAGKFKKHLCFNDQPGRKK